MPKPTREQLTALRALRAKHRDLKVEWDEATGVPKLIKGAIEPPPRPEAAPTHGLAGAPEPESEAEAAARRFLSAARSLYRMSDPDEEMATTRVQADEHGTTVRMWQTYQGVEVFDGEMVVNLDRDNTIRSVSGRYQPEITLSTTPNISADQAIQTALSDLGVDAARLPPAETRLIVVNTSSFRHRKVPGEDRNVLCWHVILGNFVYFVDAHSGEIVFKYSNIKTARNRETYYSNDCFQLPGTLWINEAGEVPGQPVDDVARAAHINAGKVYDYFKSKFGLDSFDGRGATLKSTVHCGVPDQNWTCSQNNAGWNGLQMIYGDGDGVTFGPLSKALDVVGHEITHAVIDYAITYSDGRPRGLDYWGESGALNESYADIFGTLIEDKDWLIGEDIWTPGVPGDALRNMADPPRCGQPDHYSDFDPNGNPSYVVHHNSGIMNKAAYLLVEGGTHRGVTVQGIGKEAAAAIYYRALTRYLVHNSDFFACRNALLQACLDLYPGDMIKHQAIQKAMAAVGVGPLPPEVGTPDIEVSTVALDFGAVRIGGSKSRTIQISNAGSGALVVNSISSDSASFILSENPAFTLQPAEIREVTVTFTPPAKGPYNGHLDIQSNDPDEGLVIVNLSGSGSDCLVATATYGSALSSDVEALRDLREHWLRPHTLGRALIAVYERLSPPVADLIVSRPRLQKAVRMALLPLVVLAKQLR